MTHTCSRYFDWILCRASHILQGLCPAGSKTSWFTMMLCVSMLALVSSWTSRSVSYSDRNSAMQTHTNVVISYQNKNTNSILVVVIITFKLQAKLVFIYRFWNDHWPETMWVHNTIMCQSSVIQGFEFLSSDSENVVVYHTTPLTQSTAIHFINYVISSKLNKHNHKTTVD